MLLWIAFAILAALVIAAVIRPLMRDVAHGLQAEEADTAIYQDQLAEISTDQERGLIAPEEAESARTELARRLLHRAASDKKDSSNTKSKVSGSTAAIGTRRTALASAIAIPAVAVTIYLAVGAPHLPGRPLAPRLAKPADQAPLEQLIAQVERRLKSHPNEGKGWEAIAPVYLRQRQFQKSAQAYGKAIKLLGETPQRISGFVQATVMADSGTVSDTARKASKRLLELEPGSAIARLWLAEASAQDGDHAGALTQFQDLLSTSKPDAPWRTLVENRIKQLSAPKSDKAATPKSAAVAPPKNAKPARQPGPSKADIDAAQKLTAEERATKINAMVARLATRLQTDTKDIDGWEKLVQSYVVLGRRDEAVKALETARQALAADQASLARLDLLAKRLGLMS